MTGTILSTNLKGGLLRSDDGQQWQFRWSNADFSSADVGHGQRVTFVGHTRGGMHRAILVRVVR
jgi:hypothetical protein